MVDIIGNDTVGCSTSKALPIKPPEPSVDVANPSGYPAAPLGGAEWSLSLSSITLSSSNDEQLLRTV